MSAVTLHIQGMSCGHCLNAVSKALNAVPAARVRSVQMGRADVEVDSPATVDALVAAVESAGYSATAVAPE